MKNSFNEKRGTTRGWKPEKNPNSAFDPKDKSRAKPPRDPKKSGWGWSKKPADFGELAPEEKAGLRKPSGVDNAELSETLSPVNRRSLPQTSDTASDVEEPRLQDAVARQGRKWVGKAVVGGLMTIAGGAMLMVDEHNKAKNAVERPGSGIAVGSKVQDIWLHPALLALLKQPPGTGALKSRENLSAYLKQRNAEGAWYAVNLRSLQENGKVADVATISYPSGSPKEFEEFKDTVTSLNQKSSRLNRAGNIDFSSVAITPIPDELLAVDPIKAVSELKERSASISSTYVR